VIHVERPPGPSKPSRRTERARAQAKAFYGEPAAARSQHIHRFDAGAWRELSWLLNDAFTSKCAYCESFLGATHGGDIDHFRPKRGALGLDGSFSDDHYWWLAYEWENIYLACAECNRMKGARFPVTGERAPSGTPHAMLDDIETRLLLDPCADDPEQHLIFLEDGRVASETLQGSTTCDVIGLNRSGLVSARRRAAELARMELAQAALGAEPGRFDVLLEPTREYAAMRRQLVARWLDELPAETPPASGVPLVSAFETEVTAELFTARKKQAAEFSVAGTSEDYYSVSRTVEHIEIENFRPIEHLALDVGASGEAQMPWLMLLGENGAGKSSVLQALVLALAGEKYRAQLVPDATRVLRHGTRRGSVTVRLTGLDEPIRLEFRRGEKAFTGTPREPKVLLLGYGSTRLLPRPGALPANSAQFANVGNLFNPLVSLEDPVAWIHGLQGVRFERVARALRQLLPLEPDDRFERRAGRVEVRTGGHRVTLEELSDGYQTVVALTADVMQVMLHRWPAIEAAEGIVAIDELEAHLHPRWKMRIVEALRAVFPRLQFICTTHDPLCLRGLEDGEVIVLRRGPGGKVQSELPEGPLKGLRVDQLLTSEAFGLDSTTDPEIASLLQEHRRLRRLATPTAEEQERREEVSNELYRLQVLGRDQRERLMLEAADDYLTEKSATLDRVVQGDLKERTKKRIAEIFSEEAPPA
jgi:uncharacterized protein (TIGR02646 family)